MMIQTSVYNNVHIHTLACAIVCIMQTTVVKTYNPLKLDYSNMFMWHMMQYKWADIWSLVWCSCLIVPRVARKKATPSSNVPSSYTLLKRSQGQSLVVCHSSSARQVECVVVDSGNNLCAFVDQLFIIHSLSAVCQAIVSQLGGGGGLYLLDQSLLWYYSLHSCMLLRGKNDGVSETWLHILMIRNLDCDRKVYTTK